MLCKYKYKPIHYIATFVRLSISSCNPTTKHVYVCLLLYLCYNSFIELILILYHFII